MSPHNGGTGSSVAACDMASEPSGPPVRSSESSCVVETSLSRRALGRRPKSPSVCGQSDVSKSDVASTTMRRLGDATPDGKEPAAATAGTGPRLCFTRKSHPPVIESTGGGVTEALTT